MIERFDVSKSSANFCHRVFAEEHRRRYRLAAKFLATLLPERCKRIVDAGCGDGYGSEYLGPYGDYLGLDYGPETIRIAKLKYPGTFYCMDFNKVSLPACDVVVCLETAEHLLSPLAFLMGTFDALREAKGHLVFSVPTCLTRDYDRYHLRDWTTEQVRELLRRAGFIILQEISMPFTTTFGEFTRTIPITKKDILSVALFDLLHPSYLLNRLWNWGVRQQFSWCSTLYICGTSSE